MIQHKLASGKGKNGIVILSLDTFALHLLRHRGVGMGSKYRKLELGTAVTYSLNQWGKLAVFLQDGRLEIDNNHSERSIKPVVIGRKNFLFSNTL